MSEEHGSDEITESNAPEIDPGQMQYAIEQLRSQQNLVSGAVAGLVAAMVGAGVWAGVTILTGYQIGWMAVGVGFLVGYAIRVAGKGVDTSFGVLGAGFAFLGCAAGNLFSVCGFIAEQESMPFLEVLSRLDPAVIQELMVLSFAPMDLLFYGIAIYEGYKLSFRELSANELATLVPGRN